MIRLPDPPRTFTTRQIRCISCDESFAVTEDFFEQNQHAGVNGRSTAANPQKETHWRLSPNHTPETPLRTHDVRSRRPVMSPARTEPDNVDTTSPPPNDNSFVNCPRCGADNRNWLQISNRAAPLSWVQRRFNVDATNIFILVAIFFSLALAVLGLVFVALVRADRVPESIVPLALGALFLGIIAAAVTIWPQRLFNNVTPLRPVVVGVLIAVVLAFVAFLLALQRGTGQLLTRTAPLTVATAVAGLIPAMSLTGKWRVVLRSHRRRRWLPKQAPPGGWRTPYIWSVLQRLVIYLGVIPFIIYLILPISINFAQGTSDAASPPPTADLQSLRAAIADWREEQNDVSASTGDALNVVTTAVNGYLDAGLGQQSDAARVAILRATLEEQRQSLPESLGDEIQSAVDALFKYQETLAAESGLMRLLTGLPWTFIYIWCVFIGLASIISLSTTASAVEAFVRRIDRQLPPPIFYSVANMTRIVAWEAKHALEIRGNMEHVQWMDVQRNEQGGIDLVGLHRENHNGAPPDGLVLAQRYFVRTDHWGRIVDAGIHDVRVRPTVPEPAADLMTAAQHYRSDHV